MFIIFTPWEDEEAGCSTFADVAHSTRTDATPEQFKEEWADAKDLVSDTVEEWEFDDIVKQMESQGWKINTLETTNVEY